ncbi:MAG TPA: phosphatase PAP2 family protein [Bryobacteraceae bacterium]|nr:phosphatase PAP2 family protein [Bryobacteraceae bacterium]
MPRPRPSEWLIVAFFTYVAVTSIFFHLGVRPWLLLAAVVVAILLLSLRKSAFREFAPAAFTLAAYREMNWFTPVVYDHRFENAWIIWDRRVLDTWHLRAAIESLGPVLPSYFELCYLFVYAVVFVAVGLLFGLHHRDRIDRFWVAYLAGTLSVYALFPYFPSEPPRTAFAGMDMPHVMTVVRRLNLWLLGGYGIHASVFPSAHVSSAFSAAWALLATIPERPAIGRWMAFYATSVAIATVYGRYHYAADAVAGFAMSFLAMVALWITARRFA